MPNVLSFLSTQQNLHLILTENDTFTVKYSFNHTLNAIMLPQRFQQKKNSGFIYYLKLTLLLSWLPSNLTLFYFNYLNFNKKYNMITIADNIEKWKLFKIN